MLARFNLASRTVFAQAQRRFQSSAALPQTYWRDQISKRIAQRGEQQTMTTQTKSPETAMSEWQQMVKNSNKIVASDVVEPKVVIKPKAQPAAM